MAGGAAGIVSRRGPLQGFVRIVAGGAGERAVAVAEAGGAVQVLRLVADVPGVVPVVLIIEFAGLAMAGAAEFVQTGGAEPFGIEDAAQGAFRGDVFGVDMFQPRAVTGFAVNAGFGRLHFVAGQQVHRARGVATEAAESGADGVESPVGGVGRRLMAWRDPEGFGGGVVSQAVFDDGVGVFLADVSGGFLAGAEGPMAGASRRGGREGAGMAGLRLRGEFIGMATPTDQAAGVLGVKGEDSKDEPRESSHASYKICRVATVITSPAVLPVMATFWP